MPIAKDIIIIGGGMVGAACAAGFAQLNLNIQLIEKSPLPEFDPDGPYDLRISAISAASVKLLQQLEAWQYIEKMRVCPYRGLETWEIDGFATRFHSSELKLPELGFMVENNLIQLALWRVFAVKKNVQSAVGQAIQKIEKCGQNWHVFLADGQSYCAPLLIAADGANSRLRQIAGIGVTGWQYRQRCMLILVDTEAEPQDVTWQQFFPSGPRAFLPLAATERGNQACLVWYDEPGKIRRLKQLSAEKLAEEIEQAFPARLGKIKVQRADSFELIRRHAQEYFKDGIVLVGDAAHTINPLAGQGVNLGFKDVKALLEVSERALKCGQNLADFATLARYQRERKADNLLMQTAMDVFYKAFKEDILPLKIVRNIALMAADKAVPLKKRALKYALGL